MSMGLRVESHSAMLVLAFCTNMHYDLLCAQYLVLELQHIATSQLRFVGVFILRLRLIPCAFRAPLVVRHFAIFFGIITPIDKAMHSSICDVLSGRADTPL